MESGKIVYLSRSDVEDFDLPVAGFQGTPEEIERQWFEQVYKGRGDSMLQLTWRAVLMGSLLGGVLSLTNLYIGLKAGWGFGVAITACILSYAIWTALLQGRPGQDPDDHPRKQLHAVDRQRGRLLHRRHAGLRLRRLHHAQRASPCRSPSMLGWVFFLAVLGVTMAIPMKRQMINIEQLRFPSGIAAAETLRALHSHGEKGMRAAKALGIAGLLAAVSKFWADGLNSSAPSWSRFPSAHWIEKLNEAVFGKTWMDRTVLFAWDPIFIAAGALTGLRVSASMMLGGNALLGGLRADPAAPGHHHADRGFRDVVQWTLWGGVACMVTSGLLSFACNGGARSAPSAVWARCSARRRTAHDERNRRHRNARLRGSSPASSSRWSPWRAWRRRPSTCPTGRAWSPCCSPSPWPWWPAA